MDGKGTIRAALAAGGALVALGAPPAAFADSIVFERGGNVWEASPDGSNQRQITTAGGYSRPTQAADGKILAVKGKLLHRLDRAGRVLNQAGDQSNSDITFLTPHVSPNGARVVYNLNDNGPLLFGPRVASSYSHRLTPRDEIDQSMSGYFNPSWIDDGRAVIFPANSSSIETQIWNVGGNVDDWFDDSTADLAGGEVNPQRTRFAATADGGTKIRLYTLSAPPPALPAPQCDFVGPTGSFFRPTWAPDGNRLAWQEDDGIWVAGACGQGRLVIPGGRAPDWGPAGVSPTGAAGSGPAGSNTTGVDRAAPALRLRAARRASRRTLLRGLRVRLNCSEPCRVSAELVLSRRTAKKLRLRARIARASKRLSRAGTVTLKLRPARRTRRRLNTRRLRSVTIRARAVDSAGNRSRRLQRGLRIVR